MILGIDIGGTKTLLAAFNIEGELKNTYKFPTPNNYEDFLSQLKSNITQLGVHDFDACSVGVPGVLDRLNGSIIGLGNLPWKGEKIESDIEKIVKCPTKIENDAKLAGLYEANVLDGDFLRILYLTFSTGIGFSLIVEGKIDTSVSDEGGHGVFLEHNGKVTMWEKFASGKAIVAKYGKKASEIESRQIWKEIVHNMTIGIINLNTILSPDIILIGGGVGANFHKFGDLLVEDVHRYETPLTKIPPIRGAKHAEEAVIYGCYYLAKDFIQNR
jgi:predicted NBD/HSP70 family sugar kinase